MITGLNIAKNSEKVTYDCFGVPNLDANLRATLRLEGYVKVGSEASHQGSAATIYEERPETTYVFAYRLRKLRVRRRNKFKLHYYRAGGNLNDVGRERVNVEGDLENKDNDSAFEMESASF
ncbi:hypothetical protein MPH_06517 [Macrophomina phaseolina MS6]|uniref:Uncharacterized protein n=1 Tax=Macrophomina phaseolina (strain MS6) TaxID=1126212 RepID=K2RNG5_MACPH|nr:hypothetical protein MPH_06517 [Macrophomina phaseolina MS6]